jgi:hypothetical protein
MDASQITDLQDNFDLKVIKSERGVSQLKPDGSGNNPMNVVDLEFINNPPVSVINPETGEKELVDINGLQVRNWVTLVPQAINSVNTFRQGLGLPPTTEEKLLEEDGNLYIGKVLKACVRFSGKQMKNSDGQGLTNPYTGKPVLTSERRIMKIYVP